jgi:tetratricopeptide (TPR) repeat protein
VRIFLIESMKNASSKTIWLILSILLFFLFSCVNDIAFYNDRGIDYMKKGQYDVAIAYYNGALDIDPRYAKAYNNRGVAYKKKRQYDHAIADYNKALEINPRFVEAYDNRGLAYYEKGQYDQAISDYNKALEINRRDAAAYSGLAWVLATAKEPRIRNGKKAVELALRACELSAWKNPVFLGTLAAAYAREDDFGNATKWQEKALQLSEKGEKAKAQERLNLYRQQRPWPSD